MKASQLIAVLQESIILYGDADVCCRTEGGDEVQAVSEVQYIDTNADPDCPSFYSIRSIHIGDWRAT